MKVSSSASSPLADTGAGGFTCPMHPEIRQDGPGSCPICGMALEPRTASPARRRIPNSST